MEHLNDDYSASSTRYSTAIEQQEHALFAMLKPSLQRDGNQWCVLYGEDLQTGVAGFGDTPHRAVLDFNASWYKQIETKV